MAKKNAILLTKEGLLKAEVELKKLKEEGRREVAQKIKEASAFGDLSENAEYDEAKNEQAQMEARIIQLEVMIKNVEIIDDSKSKGDNINVGTTVVLHSDKDDSDTEYTIVGAVESDPLNGRISNESPVGKAVLGHKKGDAITVKTPSGDIVYTVKKLSHKG